MWLTVVDSRRQWDRASLQNRLRRVGCHGVGSIPMRFRHSRFRANGRNRVGLRSS